MRYSHRVWPWVAVMVAILAFPFLHGCEDGRRAPATLKLAKGEGNRIPVGQGEPAFRFGNDLELPTELKRDSRAFSFLPDKDFPFFHEDFIQNVSGKEAILNEVANQSRFTLKPDTAIQIHPNALTLIKGSARFEFKKVNGEYRIKVPFATLGIRGTTLQVTVNPDQSSRTDLLEGQISVEAGGTTLPLKAGERLEIDAKGVVGRPAPLPGLNPDTYHPPAH
ncbi:MAG: FecR domain-containing protein [Candidatus Riflebacteria bacterium]|nr:FecR domain-containing protein [Candidatus Riflebacteria bacterium]